MKHPKNIEMNDNKTFIHELQLKPEKIRSDLNLAVGTVSSIHFQVISSFIRCFFIATRAEYETILYPNMNNLAIILEFWDDMFLNRLC